MRCGREGTGNLQSPGFLGCLEELFIEMEKADNGGAPLRGKSLDIQSRVSVLTEEWVECEKWTQPVQIAMAGKGRQQTNRPVPERGIGMQPRVGFCF